MKLKEQECPYCGKSQRVIKSGLNPTGSQRYKCRACVRYFTPQPKPMGYEQERRAQAIQMYLEGMSLRAIGRTVHVHHQSVANWIAAHEATLPDQVQDTTPTKTVEVDELFTYIGKKRGAST
jgi:transposase-like protein